MQISGDIIGIGDSVLPTMKQWPDFLEACYQAAFPETAYHAYKYDGSYIGVLGDGLGMSRAVFHSYLHQYALHLGIPIRHAAKAVDYFETDTEGGAVLENGERLRADIVVAADGIGSRSWRLISGTKEEPISSSFAMYRTTFPLDLAMRNTLIAEGYSGVDSRLYFGPGSHIVLGKTDKDIIWMLTHKVWLYPGSCVTLCSNRTDSRRALGHWKILRRLGQAC